jgi:hypothetical protein
MISPPESNPFQRFLVKIKTNHLDDLGNTLLNCIINVLLFSSLCFVTYYLVFQVVVLCAVLPFAVVVTFVYYRRLSHRMWIIELSKKVTKDDLSWLSRDDSNRTTFIVDQYRTLSRLFSVSGELQIYNELTLGGILSSIDSNDHHMYHLESVIRMIALCVETKQDADHINDACGSRLGHLEYLMEFFGVSFEVHSDTEKIDPGEDDEVIYKSDSDGSNDESDDDEFPGLNQHVDDSTKESEVDRLGVHAVHQGRNTNELEYFVMGHTEKIKNHTMQEVTNESE